MKSYLFITIPLGVLLSLFILRLLIPGNNVHKEISINQQQEIKQLSRHLELARAAAIPSIEQLMLEPYFKNTVIPIAGITTALPEPVLRNKIFKGCTIIGPVTFVLQSNVSFTNCSFEGNYESMLIVTTNKKIWGVVALDHDTFIDCDFKKVAFIGPQEVIDNIRKGFSN
jgi:hypothetical protein